MKAAIVAAGLVLAAAPVTATAQDAHDRMLPSADALRSVDDPSFKDSTAYGHSGYMGGPMQSGRSSVAPLRRTTPAEEPR